MDLNLLLLLAVLAFSSAFEIQTTIFKKSTSVDFCPSPDVPMEFSTSEDDVIDCLSRCLQYVVCHSVFYSLSLKTCKGYSFPNLQNASFVSTLDTMNYQEDIGKDCTHSGYVYSRSVSLCFKEYLDTAEWNQSRELCQSDNADLVILNTDDKIEYMKDFITSRYTHGYWFIGMNDVDQTGDWRWVNNEPVSTNLKLFDFDPEQWCGALNLRIGLLVDADCTQTRRRICERTF